MRVHVCVCVCVCLCVRARVSVCVYINFEDSKDWKYNLLKRQVSIYLMVNL